MKGEYLVAELSPKASQVLLALLLVRQRETFFSQAEFATRTALSRRSISEALTELARKGLIEIIARAGRPPLVRLNLEYFQDVQVTDTPITLLTHAPAPALLGPSVQTATEEAREDRTEELEPLVRCRQADATGRRDDMVRALQAIWDDTFPRDDYPFQRMTPETAKKWLVGRSAEEVGLFIQEVKAKAKSPIPYPRGYVDKALENAKIKQAAKAEVEEVEVITPDLRRLTELGRRQYSGKKT